MNKEKASKLWKIIQEAGDYLEGLDVQYNPYQTKVLIRVI